jgi:gamma-glutamyltranspeptidase/glutathione hydrolase
LITEAKKLAFADRDVFVADPDANTLPVAPLISKSYGESRRTLIDQTRARAASTGNPYKNSETVYLTVVDKDRNAVSLIESIFGGFGFSVVPRDLGFAIQNRGCGFSLDEIRRVGQTVEGELLENHVTDFLSRSG